MKQSFCCMLWGRTRSTIMSERFHYTYRKAFHLSWKERLCQRLFFFSADAYHLTFLVIFRFSILLLTKQKFRVNRITFDWKVNPKVFDTIVDTVIIVSDTYTYICCNDFTLFFSSSFFYLFCSSFICNYKRQIYASQSSHNAVQIYYTNLQVPYATMYYRCFPFFYLSLVLPLA